MLIETLSVKLQGDVSDFVAKMNSAATAVQAIGDKMQQAGDKMQAIGQKWSLYISAPLIAMGKASLDSAADFEVSMNVIEQVTGATTAQMAEMSDQALKLGKATVFSAGEAAQAQLELAKAGMTVAQTMDAMPGVLDLAAAGGVELAYAAKLTAGALNAFSLDAKESTRVANLLAAAANASAADIQDLALGFAQGGFAFAAAGQQVDDLAAGLAILTNVGLKGTDAGTALKNMFQQLYGPTNKAKDAMREFGIEIFDTNGNMKPLSDIIDIFNRQLGGLSQETRLAVLDTILMSDGMKAMIPLMEAGKDGFLKMKDAVNEQGAASNVANARMKGLAGAIEYFKGTLDSLMIETALPWLNTLSDIIRKTADWIAKFGELDPALQRNIVIFAALAAALGPVLIYTGLLVSSVGSLVKVFSLLFNPIAMIAFGIGALVIALGGGGEAFGAFGKYIKGVLDTGDHLNDWLTHLPDWIQPAAQAFGYALAYIQPFIKTLSEGIPKAAVRMRDGIYYTIRNLISIARDVWGVFVSLITGNTDAAFSGVERTIHTALATVRVFIGHVLDAVGDLFGINMSGIQDKVSATFAWLQKAVTDGFPVWVETLKGWGVAAWEWIVSATQAVIEKLTEWGLAIYQWAMDNLPIWKAQLMEWAKVAWEWITWATALAIEKLTEWGLAIWQWVTDNLPAWKAQLQTWADAAWQWITETAIPYALEKLTEWGNALYQWVADNLPIWRERLQGWAGAAYAWITETAIPYTIEKLGEWGNAAYQWLIDNLPIWKERLLLWANAAWEWVTETALPMLQQKLGELGAWLYQWLQENIPNFDAWVESVTNFAASAKEKFIVVKDYLMDVGRGFASELPAMAREVIELGETIGTEIPRILEHFNNLWSVLSGGRNGQAIGQFLGKFATTAIKALGTILTQVRAIMDAFDILVRATGAILSGDFDTYWALKDQWNKAWADFGSATADQWQQFKSMWDDTAPTPPTPSGAAGGGVGGFGGAGTNGVTITLNQSFSGNVDPAAVNSASQQGILAGLRQVGLA